MTGTPREILCVDVEDGRRCEQDVSCVESTGAITFCDLLTGWKKMQRTYFANVIERSWLDFLVDTQMLDTLFGHVPFSSGFKAFELYYYQAKNRSSRECFKDYCVRTYSIKKTLILISFVWGHFELCFETTIQGNSRG
jgi:hypothetical protein